ncbi:hypothetical protein ACIBJI_40225 [Nocardia sp. NPDC050408]|uniref:hypothetical protein n=1 Tax=Nocardia sp. NPDC050408 TaxID=3364319 RepID=UPI00378DB268
MTTQDDAAREEWLITLDGPVTNTYACLPLTRDEAAVLARLVREVASMATGEHHPYIRITPMSETTDNQRRQLAYAERERLLVSMSREVRAAS